jgi:hypothetical protein
MYFIQHMRHLPPPLRFHSVGGCWDQTQDCGISYTDVWRGKGSRGGQWICRNMAGNTVVLCIQHSLIMSLHKPAAPFSTYTTCRHNLYFLKVHKHEIFVNTFFAETESLWPQRPVTRDFWQSYSIRPRYSTFMLSQRWNHFLVCSASV